MDYKEKYEQALDNLMKIKAENKDNKELVDFIENKYPELKESEDERNIKDLIDELKCALRAANCQNDACGGGYEKRIALLEWSIAWLEKQGNPKSVDKVESKFNAGDWVVYCNEDVDLITGVEETGYIINKGSGYIPFVCEGEMRLWTIEDAKDGDVLADGDLPFIFKKIDAYNYTYAYCGISLSGNFRIESDGELGEWTWMLDIKPATKEQRELLFQKIKEAGYEWDAEKKELKEIEKKFAWSEEDEKERKRVVGLLEGWLSTFKETCYAEDCKCGIEWLKSLTQRTKGETK